MPAIAPNSANQGPPDDDYFPTTFALQGRSDSAVLNGAVEVLKVGQKANTEYLLKLIGDVNFLRAGQECFAHDQDGVLDALQASGHLE